MVRDVFFMHSPSQYDVAPRRQPSYVATLLLHVTFHHFRGKRPTPGLAAQHVSCARLVRDVTGMRVVGSSLHSQVLPVASSTGAHPPSPPPPLLSPAPMPVIPVNEADTGTAGAVPYVLPAALPSALAVAPARLSLSGGTAVTATPPLNHVTLVLYPSSATSACG